MIGDGCTDDSAEIVEAIDDARVQWVNLPMATLHQSGPNNEGLRRARGDIIAYLGHDDLWLPHHLDVMVAALDRTDSDLAYALIANVAPDEFMWPTIPDPAAGSFASPLGIVHRKRMTDRIGGWRHYREVTDTPDVELWKRAKAADCDFTFVPRFTGIKFPASIRRDVYRERPCHQQAQWAARIEAEPELEFTLSANFIIAQSAPSGVPYRVLLRNFMRQTVAQLRKRCASLLHGPEPKPRSDIDTVRRFKGL